MGTTQTGVWGLQDVRDKQLQSQWDYDGGNYLFTFGCNEQGKLGHNNTQPGNNLSSPTQVPGVWSHVNVQKPTQRRIIAATKPDGTLWTWGGNTAGGLGHNQGPGDLGALSSPTQVPGTWSLKGFGGTGVGIIATKPDGTMWAWGDNTNGELGINNRTRYSSPVQIPGTTWSTTFEMIAGANENVTAAIKTDGTLWTWGRNTNGQLGLNEGSNSYKSSPTQVGSDATWAKIFGSKQMFQGIKTDNTAWVWGRGIWGSLGLNQGGTDDSRSSPTQIPGEWSSIRSGGYGNNFGVKTDNSAWVWGYGHYGVLGLGTNEAVISSPTQLGSSYDWKMGDFSLFPFGIAVKTNGTMWAMGRNNDQGGGNLGQNNRTQYNSPVQIPGTSWTYATNEFAASYALKTAE